MPTRVSRASYYSVGVLVYEFCWCVCLIVCLVLCVCLFVHVCSCVCLFGPLLVCLSVWLFTWLVGGLVCRLLVWSVFMYEVSVAYFAFVVFCTLVAAGGIVLVILVLISLSQVSRPCGCVLQI